MATHTACSTACMIQLIVDGVVYQTTAKAMFKWPQYVTTCYPWEFVLEISDEMYLLYQCLVYVWICHTKCISWHKNVFAICSSITVLYSSDGASDVSQHTKWWLNNFDSVIVNHLEADIAVPYECLRRTSQSTWVMTQLIQETVRIAYFLHFKRLHMLS